MKYHRWIIKSRSALYVVSLLLISGSGARAEVCSNGTTVGHYVVVGDGYLSPGPNAPLVPAKLLSTVTANAAGDYSGTGTVDVGGQVFTQDVAGIQQLHPDCTGTITYKQTLNGQPAPDITFNFVVSEHGERIDGISVDPGSVFSAVLRRLD